jgi:hypothetical protein
LVWDGRIGSILLLIEGSRNWFVRGAFEAGKSLTHGWFDGTIALLANFPAPRYGIFCASLKQCGGWSERVS